MEFLPSSSGCSREETALDEDSNSITIKPERLEFPEDPLSLPETSSFLRNYDSILSNHLHLEAKRRDVVSIQTRTSLIDRRTLREHHSRSFPQLENEFSYACAECGAYFRNKPSYKYHVSSQHRQLTPRDSVGDTDKRGDENEGNRKRGNVNASQDEEFVKRIIESVRAELAANGESSTRRGYRKHS